MRPLSVSAAAVIATAALAAGCGGDADEPPSAISEDDLPAMVLQLVDVHPDFRQLPVSPGDTGFFEDGLSDSQTAYIVDFELPPEEAEPSETVCVRSAAHLYKTPEEAIEALREGQELQQELEEEGHEFLGEEVALPDLGDQTHFGWRVSYPSTDFCSYKDKPAEAYLIVFRQSSVVGALVVFTYEGGASLDEAIKLAQKQAGRIEDAFEGESHD